MQIVLWNLRRNEKRMTQQELADYLGIAVQTYREKEKGNAEFTQDEMFMIANFLVHYRPPTLAPRKIALMRPAPA